MAKGIKSTENRIREDAEKRTKEKIAKAKARAVDAEKVPNSAPAEKVLAAEKPKDDFGTPVLPQDPSPEDSKAEDKVLATSTEEVVEITKTTEKPEQKSGPLQNPAGEREAKRRKSFISQAETELGRSLSEDEINKPEACIRQMIAEKQKKDEEGKRISAELEVLRLKEELAQASKPQSTPTPTPQYAAPLSAPPTPVTPTPQTQTVAPAPVSGFRRLVSVFGKRFTWSSWMLVAKSLILIGAIVFGIVSGWKLSKNFSQGGDDSYASTDVVTDKEWQEIRDLQTEIMKDARELVEEVEQLKRENESLRTEISALTVSVSQRDQEVVSLKEKIAMLTEKSVASITPPAQPSVLEPKLEPSTNPAVIPVTPVTSPAVTPAPPSEESQPSDGPRLKKNKVRL